MSALQRLLNLYPGYKFEEATEPLVFGPVLERDRVKGVPLCAWKCPATQCLKRLTGAERIEAWRTVAYVVMKKERLISRYTVPASTATQLEKVDIYNDTGAGFPEGMMFVFLPPRKSATLKHARSVRAKYKAGVGGARKRADRVVRRFSNVRHDTGSTIDDEEV